MRLHDKLKALTLDFGSSKRTKTSRGTSNPVNQKQESAPAPNMPAFQIEELPNDIIEKVVGHLDEASLRQATLAQKKPSTDFNRALVSAWTHHARSHGVNVRPLRRHSPALTDASGGRSFEEAAKCSSKPNF